MSLERTAGPQRGHVDGSLWRDGMTKIAAKVAERISSGLKRFQPILDSARARDINESDTVVIVTDMLQYILGYDKYAEITSEHAIRGTYCDLAIKLDGKLSLLIEVKAIGLSLKDNYVKQAVDYASNQGCDWVVLTNGILWHAFRITFAKPIEHELVLDIDLSKLSPKKATDIELLWLISREGVQKAGLEQYRSQREALSRFTLAALLQTDSILDVLRRELRRISPDAKIESEDICAVLTNEVLKREALEGEKAQAATRAVARAANRTLRKAASNADESVESATVALGPKATEQPA
jgi:hypothetical protein